MCPQPPRDVLKTARNNNLIKLTLSENQTRGNEKWQSLEADCSKTGRQHPEMFFPVTNLSFLFMFIKSFCRLKIF